MGCSTTRDAWLPFSAVEAIEGMLVQDFAYDIAVTDGVAFIRLAGEVDLAVADEVRRLGMGAINDVETVRIDLSAVTFLDSTGLSALIAIGNAATASGRALILEKPAPNVYRIFELTGLAVGGPFAIEAG